MFDSLKEFFSQKFGEKKPVRNKASYLVEFRFHGYTKKYVKKISKKISKKFKVRRTAKPGKPPHITLYGGFKTDKEREVIKRFARVCKKHDLVKFKSNGFNHIGKKVIFLDLKPSSELMDFRNDFVKELKPISESKPWDELEKESILHITLAFKDIEEKFDKIWSYVNSLKEPNIEQFILRVTLLKNGKILREYDLIQRTMFRRRQALNKKNFKKTLGFLREIMENNGKRKTIELTEKPSASIFLISDLHLDHKNIIKYTKRPFENVKEMNKTIVKNWNNTVTEKDTVYFLGDLAFGKNSRKPGYWLKKLNGKIKFIEGNHEKVKIQNFYPTAYNVFLSYKGNRFCLIHDPAQKPKNWQGWTIHGHHHNNDLEKYPLINHKNKTINVSAELLNYTPTNLNKLLKKIKENQTNTTKNPNPTKELNQPA